MAEQAGEDRVLFLNTRPQEHVEMKFPEYVCFLKQPSLRIANVKLRALLAKSSWHNMGT